MVERQAGQPQERPVGEGRVVRMDAREGTR
jgi:hypothetical protein